MKQTSFKIFSFAVLATVLSMPASAAVIYQAVSATTTAAHDSPSNFGYINQVINQDGLASNYVSGSTDFTSFVTSTMHTGGLSTFGSFASPFPMSFDFNLGTSLQLDRVAIWNQSGTASLNSFELLASASGLFNDLVSLGNFSIAQGYHGQTVSFAATNMVGLRMVVQDSSGYPNALRFTEIAFGGTASSAPEPAPLALLGAGLALCLARRKRLQKD